MKKSKVEDPIVKAEREFFAIIKKVRKTLCIMMTVLAISRRKSSFIMMRITMVIIYYKDHNDDNAGAGQKDWSS